MKYLNEKGFVVVTNPFCVNITEAGNIIYRITDDGGADHGSSSPTPSPDATFYINSRAVPMDCFQSIGAGFARCKNKNGSAPCVQAPGAYRFCFVCPRYFFSSGSQAGERTPCLGLKPSGVGDSCFGYGSPYKCKLPGIFWKASSNEKNLWR